LGVSNFSKNYHQERNNTKKDALSEFFILHPHFFNYIFFARQTTAIIFIQGGTGENGLQILEL
jgi:hypothetical protein